MEPIYETVRRVSKKLPDNSALIGFAGAPWTLATYMVEGSGSRDYPNAKGWALGEPDTFQSLINLLVDATSAYLIRQVEAGAEPSSCLILGLAFYPNMLSMGLAWNRSAKYRAGLRKCIPIFP